MIVRGIGHVVAGQSRDDDDGDKDDSGSTVTMSARPTLLRSIGKGLLRLLLRGAQVRGGRYGSSRIL